MTRKENNLEGLNSSRDKPKQYSARTRLRRDMVGDNLAKVWAPCGAIWHTSSKGMPRHAHRRWALIRFSDVDKY